MRHIYLLMREKSLFGKPASTQCTLQGVISSCLYVLLLLLCPSGRIVHSCVATFNALHKRCYQNALKWLCHKKTMRTTWPMEITYVRLAAWLVVCCPKRVKSPFGPPTTTPQSKPFIINSSSSAKPPWPKRDFEEAPPATTIQSLHIPSTSFCKIFNKRGQKSTQIRSLVYGNNFAHFSANPFSATTTTASLPDIPFLWLRVTWTRLKTG